MMLTNGNIVLRALEPDDVELLYQWENDVTVWRVSNTHAPLSRFILASYIKSADRDIWESKMLRLVIEDEDKNPVGTIELFDFEPYHSRVGLGIMIYDKEKRRKGIAKQAVELMTDYALSELGLAQLFVNIAESNEASLNLFQKLGFELVGTKKKWLRVGQEWEDELLFQKFL